MKKITLLLLSIIVCCTLSAQQIKFMGVPLTGTITNFHTKMTAKGLKIHPDNKDAGVGNRLYKGKFAGYETQIMVAYDATSKLVYGAAVVFDPHKEIDGASSQYISIKRDLIAKYGTDNVVESKIDASALMSGLISEHKVYLDDGTIKIKLEEDDDIRAYRVYLYYTNMNNLEKHVENEKKRAQNDL